ncbi:potassium voltage-gated channel protein Shaw-like [Mercenaria mercenaria]|uniref:potassium voltage-gated channel protein Shaw-like n=1 Tax=Mercenaria mercenaria TaxID=6596 RepID=UPI00234F24FF|nr:potassium voltage-gated channel protein Shaw-like [Mercenaria mercenaria]
MAQVKLNVSGTIFEIDIKELEGSGFQRLTAMCYDASKAGKPLEFKINRPAGCFSAILSHYQTGELHMPTGVCPGAFRRELEYWEVDYGVMQECCLYKYQSFIDDEETRNSFLDKAVTSAADVSAADSSVVIGKYQKFRKRLWKIVDNNETSVLAKVYFYLVFFMVLLSIVSMAYSTEPSMRRPVSECEMIEYMQHSENIHASKVQSILGNPDCSNSESWDKPFYKENFKWTFFTFSWGWSTFQRNNANNDTNTANSSGQRPNMLQRILQGGAKTTEVPEEEEIYIPDLTVPKLPFCVIDHVVNAFFTIDLILRLVSCPSLLQYFRSVINILDTVALICCYVYKVTVTIEKEYLYMDSTWVLLLNYMQVFRTLRLFRVVKNVRASKVLAYSLSQDVRDITLLALLLIVGISTFACLFYFAESRETIPSIPNAWYWAIVTMTTVGYGDISPETGFGRVIASICAICGVLLLAVTLPMFVNNFLTLYQYSCVHESIEKRKNEKVSKEILPGEQTNCGTVKPTTKFSEFHGYSVNTKVKPPAYTPPKKPVDNFRENTIYHVKEAEIKQQLS